MHKNTVRSYSFQRLIFIFASITALVCTPLCTPPACGDEDCDDYYFGITGEPAFAHALKCYAAENRKDMLILMHMNGEGAPASLQKAEALFKAWQKALPDEANSLDGEALKKAIDERMRNPQKKYPRLQYCGDIAGTTYALGACASIKKRKEEKSSISVITAAKAKLKPVDAALLDTVHAEFKAFNAAESDRMYQQYIDGSIRSVAAVAQEKFVRDQFLKLVKETIEHKGLKPADENAFKATDAELNLVYRQRIQDYSKTYENLAKHEASVETKNTYKQYIDAYKKASKKAQLHWIKYRDLCADLAASLYSDKASVFDPALSMKTLVTKVRISELRNDPVEGN